MFCRVQVFFSTVRPRDSVSSSESDNPTKGEHSAALGVLRVFGLLKLIRVKRLITRFHSLTHLPMEYGGRHPPQPQSRTHQFKVVFQGVFKSVCS